MHTHVGSPDGPDQLARSLLFTSICVLLVAIAMTTEPLSSNTGGSSVACGTLIHGLIGGYPDDPVCEAVHQRQLNVATINALVGLSLLAAAIWTKVFRERHLGTHRMNGSTLA